MQYDRQIDPVNDKLILNEFVVATEKNDIDSITINEYKKLKEKCDSVISRIRFRKANKLKNIRESHV